MGQSLPRPTRPARHRPCPVPVLGRSAAHLPPRPGRQHRRRPHAPHARHRGRQPARRALRPSATPRPARRQRHHQPPHPHRLPAPPTQRAQRRTAAAPGVVVGHGLHPSPLRRHTAALLTYRCPGDGLADPQPGAARCRRHRQPAPVRQARHPPARGDGALRAAHRHRTAAHVRPPSNDSTS